MIKKHKFNIQSDEVNFIIRGVAESLHLKSLNYLTPSSLDPEGSQSEKEDTLMSSTARSSVVLQKGAGKRVAEDSSDLSSIGKKMKGNRVRHWMDDSEGRVIHTAGKHKMSKKLVL